MNIGGSLTGLLEVELTSAALPETLVAINEVGIEIIGLKWINELTCVFNVRRRCYHTLKKCTVRSGASLKIRSHLGIFWKGRSILRRPWILVVVLFFLILSVYLPRHVLFVRVEGNYEVPARMILESAEKHGVRFGASRRDLRSERIKNGILSDIAQLQWVGVNTSGCVATVSVRESAIHRQESKQAQVTQIVAAEDGYILSGTVESGTAMFREGQSVQRGQLLISGYVNSDFCIRAVRAEGDIWAQTNRQMMAATPDTHFLRTDFNGVKRVISLRFRKKRINLWKDSGILPTTCGRMYEEYYIPLPGGFRLPAALCVEKYTLWDVSQSTQNLELARNQLCVFSERYLHTQMIAGTIRNCIEKIHHENGAFVLTGNYVCEEMIGREQPEQIGVTNGKNN